MIKQNLYNYLDKILKTKGFFDYRDRFFILSKFRKNDKNGVLYYLKDKEKILSTSQRIYSNSIYNNIYKNDLSVVSNLISLVESSDF